MMVTGATAFVRPPTPARILRTNPPRFYAANNDVRFSSDGDGDDDDEVNNAPSAGELLDAAMDWKEATGFDISSPLPPVVVSEFSDSDLMMLEDEDDGEEEEASFNDMLEFGAADLDDDEDDAGEVE